MDRDQARLSLRFVLAVTLVLTAVGLMAWLRVIQRSPVSPAGAAPQVPPDRSQVIRLGIVPERDIFQQRKRYLALTRYLSAKIGRPIELATAAAYQDLLRDIGDQSLDAAFAGSYTTVLAVDRFHARVLAHPVMQDGSSSYRGVIMVPANSPIQKIENLRGRSLAGVRATTAGHLFPFAQFKQSGLLPGTEPDVRMVWVGTHDDVIAGLIEGTVDAGAVKESRLDAWERAHGSGQFRRLFASAAVPENALLLRAGLDGNLAEKLTDALMHMADDPAGRETLQAFGALRFEPCQPCDYGGVYDMIAALGASWPAMGIDGPPPKRPG